MGGYSYYFFCNNLTQEQIDAISQKYGLESPAQQTEALTGADWGVSIKESPAAQP